MAQSTVQDLAAATGTPVDRLLEQFKDAGIIKSASSDVVTEEEKLALLEHIRASRTSGAGGKKITLKRRTTSEIKVGGSAAGKRVNVEVRGRKTVSTRIAENDAIDPRQAQALAERERRERELAEMEAKRKAAEEAIREEERQRAERLKREKEGTAEPVQAESVPESNAPDPTPVVEPTEAPAEKPSDADASAASTSVEQEPANAEIKQEAKTPADVEAAAEKKEAEKDRKDRKPSRDDIIEQRERAAELVAKSRAARNAREAKRSKGKGGASLQPQRDAKHGFSKPTAPVVREVLVPETITVSELANRMAIKGAQLVKALFKMGEMATINQVIDQDTAVLLVEEMGHKATVQSAADVEKELTEAVKASDAVASSTRPPVVTVMGHVDHGKTSLLDYIRRSRVTAGEAGGITQHIGAYHVETSLGVVTFLDTPGHAAFTAMRARGAQATDIVVLVVAADDGVMPQTIEAIQHARAAKVPLIVAVNKIDKPEADPDRVRSELTQHEVVAEDWGGDTQFVNVSAHSGQGIDELLDALSLQAEVLELKAPPTGNASGIVIEASLDRGRGSVATVLVQQGLLEKGQMVVCGKEFGRVRAMFDENGQPASKAGPSIPVQILGLSGVPSAGDEMIVASDERAARELVNFRAQRERDSRLAGRKMSKLEDVFDQIQDGDRPTLNLFVKADVQGSFEALRDSLEKISNDEISIKVMGGGVGGINESDANLAAASGAVVVGFNVRADASARRILQEQGVELHYHSIIYEAIDVVKKAASGLLTPEVHERIIGMAEVQDVFKSPKLGAIAGCQVVEGVVRRSAPIRVLRENVVIYEGDLESLRRYKDDVNEVRAGTECGIGVKNYNDVRVGDQIEVFERTEVARSL
ncbi:MAG: translation initiation factor IF-2 [Gammaproteobacteria bacterium]|nr:translation initiation factor IF-2 [Gammaproteobacteria bacterium]